jgi:nitronate monooxygenase
VTRHRLADRLGVELPIIQAPMAGSQLSALTIAASNAGALGSLPAGMLSPDGLRDEIVKVQAGTSHPYKVNFFCHAPPVPDAARDTAWRKLLARYYTELGVDPEQSTPSPVRSPFSSDYADAIEPFTPPIVSFHFGLPSPGLVQRVKSWGSFVIGCATTVDEARWLEVRGVDAIIAQGNEAGGHRGIFLTSDLTTQVGTFALVPQVVSAVSVPVIATGGIADARGVAAVLQLGASAAQIGTSYLRCPEATTSAVHRAALASPDAQHTALTNLFSGRPARGIVNRLMRELGPLNDAAPDYPLASAALAPLRAVAEQSGSGDFSPLWSGENATGCRPIPAAEITRELARAL